MYYWKIIPPLKITVTSSTARC